MPKYVVSTDSFGVAISTLLAAFRKENTGVDRYDVTCGDGTTMRITFPKVRTVLAYPNVTSALEAHNEYKRLLKADDWHGETGDRLRAAWPNCHKPVCHVCQKTITRTQHKVMGADGEPQFHSKCAPRPA